VFQSLLSNLRPACSIEVGTETGTTLALIARHSTRAISIDIDPGVKSRLQDKFENVEFITGSSHDVLPVLLSRLTGEGVTPDFLFVDGDHSAAGVLKDLEFILKLTPTKQMIVLMHDTFNPGCRQGILAASWTRNPHCHFVDLDFLPRGAASGRLLHAANVGRVGSGGFPSPGQKAHARSQADAPSDL
jgi:cephalosporin hydroxylase